MQSWYAVYTQPRKEGVAHEHLARQGFQTYWPRYRKSTSHARKLQEVTASLFPRYLFASFDAADAGWRVIRSTRGVIGIVRQGLAPAPVPQRLVDEIRAHEDRDGYVLLGRQIELQKGRRIEIKGSAFKGHDLIFETQKDENRVVALLNLLGREFQVDVPIAALSPLSMA